MRKRYRLTQARDFQRVLGAQGRVYTGHALIAFALPGTTGRTRVGVTVSRQLRRAVDRNRARRRLREAARSRLLGEDGGTAGEGGFDVVLIARPAALVLPFADLLAEAAAAGQRIRSPGVRS